MNRDSHTHSSQITSGQADSAQNRLRWMSVYNNTSSDIPPFGVCPVSSVDNNGVFQIQSPSNSELPILLLNGPLTIAANAYGKATREGPWWAAYDDTYTPSIGEMWGPGTTAAPFRARPMHSEQGAQVGLEIVGGTLGSGNTARVMAIPCRVPDIMFGYVSSTDYDTAGAQNFVSGITNASGVMNPGDDTNSGWVRGYSRRLDGEAFGRYTFDTSNASGGLGVKAEIIAPLSVRRKQLGIIGRNGTKFNFFPLDGTYENVICASGTSIDGSGNVVLTTDELGINNYCDWAQVETTGTGGVTLEIAGKYFVSAFLQAQFAPSMSGAISYALTLVTGQSATMTIPYAAGAGVSTWDVAGSRSIDINRWTSVGSGTTLGLSLTPFSGVTGIASQLSINRYLSGSL